MNDLTVLHLSDLHIDDTGIRKSLLLQNLLTDIESEMQYSHNIIITVTGDLVNRANYRNQNEILDFFKQLRDVLGDKVKHIYIVPGNHDKVRSDMDRKILDEIEALGEDYGSGQTWKYVRVAFEEHLALVRQIYEIFYSPDQVPDRVFEDTYGVHIDEIDGKNVCVIQFNTAWTSEGENDQRNLLIGRYQLRQIRESYANKYNELKNKHIDLTIALAHHPLNWLTGKEEDMVREEILNPTGLNVNTYICGHTHNRDVINWHNNRRSMTTLVSGLGWPDGSTQHPYAHTYSSYVFNLDANSVDVYVRSSDDAYAFAPDFRIYTNQTDRKNKKIVMPIDTCKTQAYFNLGSGHSRSPKAYYITEDTMSELEGFIQIYLECEDKLHDRLESIKNDFLAICEEKKNDLPFEIEKMWSGVEKLSSPVQWSIKQKKSIAKEFSGYLTMICKVLYKSIQRMKENAELRIHFRYWKSVEQETVQKHMSNDVYVQLSLYGKGYPEHSLTELDWGQLIKEAYFEGKPLIASVNTDFCKESMDSNNDKTEDDLKHKWLDFITVIPQFEQNNYVIKDAVSEKISFSRPLLTFGITVYRDEDRDILYMLDYLRINRFIGRQINKFFHYFPMDLVECIRLIKEEDNN
ncbi:metallophosphoesterase family protein [Lachnoclostridium sp. An118]|uniref:metallophosphoesterase family protein n=1 Tax=Lachnoclostridium sp. An118 TaxID=1965547 RepID=UPI000B397738|nr:metallophosphoesterase [Lachnoclostridium sp. An118]OUQ47384.1 hypothetical protein B5E62_15385 [Lachnoclostridium sp. An118]